MPNSSAKVTSDILFDSHEPIQITTTLLRIRAYLLAATHSE
jgi:hypothetical protein